MTGRPSIPETPDITPRSRGVLDRPVKPGDDSLVVAGVLPIRSFFPGAKATKQSSYCSAKLDCFGGPTWPTTRQRLVNPGLAVRTNVSKIPAGFLKVGVYQSVRDAAHPIPIETTWPI
jgi:hypothetical protein